MSKRQKCSICRKSGHNKRTCPQMQKRRQACTYCRKPGHNIRTCSRKKADEEKKRKKEERRRLEEKKREKKRREELKKQEERRIRMREEEKKRERLRRAEKERVERRRREQKDREEEEEERKPLINQKTEIDQVEVTSSSMSLVMVQNFQKTKDCKHFRKEENGEKNFRNWKIYWAEKKGVEIPLHCCARDGKCKDVVLENGGRYSQEVIVGAHVCVLSENRDMRYIVPFCNHHNHPTYNKVVLVRRSHCVAVPVCECGFLEKGEAISDDGEGEKVETIENPIEEPDASSDSSTSSRTSYPTYSGGYSSSRDDNETCEKILKCLCCTACIFFVVVVVVLGAFASAE